MYQLLSCFVFFRSAHYIVFIFAFKCLSMCAQIDTIDFAKTLTSRQQEVKANWDAHMQSGETCKTLFTNKKYAMDCNNIFLIEYFVRLDSLNLDFEIESAYSIFAHGCYCGNDYILRNGLLNKIDINQKSKNGMTPLMLSIENGKDTIAKILIDAGADINTVDNYGRNALTLSSQFLDDTSIIKSLLQKGANLDFVVKNSGSTAMEIAYSYEKPSVFNYLLKLHEIKNDTTWFKQSNIISMAIAGGDTTLLDKYLPVCDPIMTKKKAARYIMEASAFAEYYALLNKYRGDPGDTTSSLYNTKDLDIAVFKSLVNYGYDINGTDSLGRNALYLSRDNPDVVNFLILNHINLNCVDIYGKTFLQYFIDDLIYPSFLANNIRFTYELSQSEIEKKLELLNYYIMNGARVGEDRIYGWQYFYERITKKDPHGLFEIVKNLKSNKDK